MAEFLSLKAGRIKVCDFGDNVKAEQMLSSYDSGDLSVNEEKLLINMMIDAMNIDSVFIDFENQYVSKEQAKSYVSTYPR